MRLGFGIHRLLLSPTCERPPRLVWPRLLLVVRCASIGTAAESALNTREQSRASRRVVVLLSLTEAADALRLARLALVQRVHWGPSASRRRL